VAGGVAAGLLGAAAAAALMGRLSAAFSGTGQPVFEAAVLLSAVVMLGWHNVWMARHGRELSERLKHLGRETRLGRASALALAGAVAMAVLREGSEVVLFLYGVAASGAGTGSLLAGGALGLAGGAALGAALYQGLVHLPVKHFFRAMSWLILLLAAGMASQAAAFLNQADILPPIKDSLWNTSWLIGAQSLPGAVLKTLVGYTPNPSGLQFLFYAGTFLVVGGLMRRAARQ
jgi:high-affinity iron transporter